MATGNSFKAKDELKVGGNRYAFFSLPRAEAAGLNGAGRLPYCLQILLRTGPATKTGDNVEHVLRPFGMTTFQTRVRQD
jgi:aconitate hydratase